VRPCALPLWRSTCETNPISETERFAVQRGKEAFRLCECILGVTLTKKVNSSSISGSRRFRKSATCIQECDLKSRAGGGYEKCPICRRHSIPQANGPSLDSVGRKPC
jgi:hypothetical protein